MKLKKQHRNVVILLLFMFFITLYIAINYPGEFKAGLIYFGFALVGFLVYLFYRQLKKLL